MSQRLGSGRDRGRRFEKYVAEIVEALGHADRAGPFRAYCIGLLGPSERKSVEPMAAVVDPCRVSGRHQSMHHFVSSSAWSDRAVLAVACRSVLGALRRAGAEAFRPRVPFALDLFCDPAQHRRPMTDLSWCEVDVEALAHNVRVLKSLLPPGSKLAPTVKSDAYGHGLVLAAQAFLEGGADWLCVNALFEAEALRKAQVQCPIYVMGFVPPEDVERALELDLRLVAYRGDVVERAEAVCARRGWTARLHLKLETGNERQGLRDRDALELARRIHDSPHLELEGVASHYANIEDTTDHTFAREQLRRFDAFLETLARSGIQVPLPHFSNSAAVILWSDEHQRLARVGIAAYGMWPSSETLVAAVLAGRKQIELRPALTWKTRIAQLKDVPKGAFVGYGCSYQTTSPSRLAVLPVGYYDGYDRGLSNLAYALVRGQRAPVRGRVCMNMAMIDVTDVPGLDVRDEVVLLGRSGESTITAEQLGSWIGTINYEVTTRIGSHVPRRPVRLTAPAHDPRAPTLPR